MPHNKLIHDKYPRGEIACELRDCLNEPAKSLRMQEKLKILYLIGQLQVGGAEKQLVMLVKHLDSSRFEPIVCSLSENAPLAAELRDANVEVIILAQKMRPDLTRFYRIFKIVIQIKPDLIHSYMFVANTWARLVGLVTNVPVIVSVRSSETSKPLWMRVIDRLLAPFSRLMIANSFAGADLAIRRREIAPSRVIVIYNGFDQEEFSNVLKTDIRSEFDIGHDRFLIGVIGRFEQPKGHEVFFRSFSQVTKKNPRLHVICVGDGPLKSQLLNLVEKLDINMQVIFTGVRKDIFNFLSSIDMLVIPSYREGLPNVLVESLWSGCPIIASGVGDIPELIINEENGLLVEPGDVNDLSNSIERMVLDGALRRKFIFQGRKMVDKKISLGGMVQATQEVYLKITKGVLDGKCINYPPDS